MRSRLLPLLVVAAMGLTACGTDDTSTEAEGVPTTDAEDPVVLAFDGQQVPLAEACTGADGAILATTEGEVTITLVRGDDVALRYASEDAIAESEEVAVTTSQDENLYAATLSSEQVEPLSVTMAVMASEGQVLPSCE